MKITWKYVYGICKTESNMEHVKVEITKKQQRLKENGFLSDMKNITVPERKKRPMVIASQVLPGSNVSLYNWTPARILQNDRMMLHTN